MSYMTSGELQLKFINLLIGHPTAECVCSTDMVFNWIVIVVSLLIVKNATATLRCVAFQVEWNGNETDFFVQ